MPEQSDTNSEQKKGLFGRTRSFLSRFQTQATLDKPTQTTEETTITEPAKRVQFLYPSSKTVTQPQRISEFVKPPQPAEIPDQPPTFKRPKNENLPSGFREVNRTDQELSLTDQEIPWLNRVESVDLVHIVLSSSDGEFFYGSLIRGKLLIDAANALDQHRSQIANNLLYTHLPDMIAHNHSKYATILDNTRTERPIYYFGNKGGQRVYFMRFQTADNKPIIVRVATCDKSDQGDVLSVLTTDSRKQNKKVGRL